MTRFSVVDTPVEPPAGMTLNNSVVAAAGGGDDGPVPSLPQATMTARNATNAPARITWILISRSNSRAGSPADYSWSNGLLCSYRSVGVEVAAKRDSDVNFPSRNSAGTAI